MVGVCERECMWRSQGYEPLTLMRCHSYMKLLKGGSPSVAEQYNLKGIKGKFSLFFLFFLKLCFSFTVADFMA